MINSNDLKNFDRHSFHYNQGILYYRGKINEYPGNK